jgi:hypothetical protein
VTIIAIEKQYYIFRVCVCSLCYKTCNAHALYRIAICGLSGPNIFYCINSQMARFLWEEGGGDTSHKTCVFLFLTILTEIFLILRRIKRDVFINVHRSSCTVEYQLVLSDFMNLEFSRRFAQKTNVKFHENPFSGSRVVSCRRADGRTDKMKLKVAFRNLRTRPKRS